MITANHARLFERAAGDDAAVLFGGGPLGTKNVDLFIESYRAYNRWLADFCSHDRRRLAGVAYIPLRDVDEQVIAGTVAEPNTPLADL